MVERGSLVWAVRVREGGDGAGRRRGLAGVVRADAGEACSGAGAEGGGGCEGGVRRRVVLLGLGVDDGSVRGGRGLVDVPRVVESAGAGVGRRR